MQRILFYTLLTVLIYNSGCEKSNDESIPQTFSNMFFETANKIVQLSDHDGKFNFFFIFS